MKNCILAIGRPAKYWGGKNAGWVRTKAAAARYTLTGAKRVGEMLADYYGKQVRVESLERAENPVPASSRAGKHRAAHDDVEKAADLYARFTGHEPHKKARTVNVPERAYLRVGSIDGILYTTQRDGQVEKYIHHFRPRSRPALAVSHDGKELRSIGGRFTFTERGFVDEDRDGQAVE